MIGPGTTVRGDVTGGDAVEIRGTLEGDCRITAHCSVREGARVLGNIEATSLVVGGEVEAGTLVAEKVEIRASARVRALITARVVAIADGAFYQGEVQMQGTDAASGPVYFRDRRRSPDQGPLRA